MNYLLNFLRIMRHPFTMQEAMHGTGLPKATLLLLLPQAEKAGVLRCISLDNAAQQVWLARPPQIVLCRQQYDFKPSPTKLRRLLSEMVSGQSYSARELAEAAQMPLRTTYRYLQSLEHLGCIQGGSSKARRLGGTAWRKVKSSFETAEIIPYFAMNKKRKGDQ